ncbi:MAG: diguanylate cyclase domain-containing protein, partial [bacterium]
MLDVYKFLEEKKKPTLPPGIVDLSSAPRVSMPAPRQESPSVPMPYTSALDKVRQLAPAPPAPDMRPTVQPIQPQADLMRSFRALETTLPTPEQQRVVEQLKAIAKPPATVKLPSPGMQETAAQKAGDLVRAFRELEAASVAHPSQYYRIPERAPAPVEPSIIPTEPSIISTPSYVKKPIGLVAKEAIDAFKEAVWPVARGLGKFLQAPYVLKRLYKPILEDPEIHEATKETYEQIIEEFAKKPETAGEQMLETIGSLVPFMVTATIGAPFTAGPVAASTGKILVRYLPKFARSVAGKAITRGLGSAALGGTISAGRQAFKAALVPEEFDFQDVFKEVAGDIGSFFAFGAAGELAGKPVREGILRIMPAAVRQGKVTWNLVNLLSAAGGGAATGATIAATETALNFMKNPKEFDAAQAQGDILSTMLFFAGVDVLFALTGMAWGRRGWTYGQDPTGKIAAPAGYKWTIHKSDLSPGLRGHVFIAGTFDPVKHGYQEIKKGMGVWVLPGTGQQIYEMRPLGEWYVPRYEMVRNGVIEAVVPEEAKQEIRGLLTAPVQKTTERPPIMRGAAPTASPIGTIKPEGEGITPAEAKKAAVEVPAAAEREVKAAEPMKGQWRKPNIVFREVRGMDGQFLGIEIEPYDGTKEGAIRAAKAIEARLDSKYPDWSNINSRIGATDAQSMPKYTISPNLQHVADVNLETPEARYIWGDVEAIVEGGLKDDAAVEAETTSEAERRTNLALRAEVDELSPEEKDEVIRDLRARVFTDELTGLKNRAAYMIDEKQPFQAIIDLDNLKWVNDNIGHGAGDTLIKTLAGALPENSYRISGDEFIIQGQSKEELESLLSGLEARLNEQVLELAGDKQTVSKKGIGFSYGIGETLDKAETALQEHKKARLAAGKRVERGEVPEGIDIPKREEATKSEVAPAEITPFTGEITEENIEAIDADLSRMGVNIDRWRRSVNAKTDLDAIAEKYPNIFVRFKDVNGQRHSFPIKEAAELVKIPEFTDRIREAWIHFDKPHTNHKEFIEGMREQKIAIPEETAPTGIMKPIEGVELQNNSTISKGQQAKFVAAVSDPAVRSALQENNIKRVVIEPPYKFGLSEQGKINLKAKTIQINADADDPRNTILHEIGHVVYKNFSAAEKKAWKNILANIDNKAVAGYKSLGKLADAFSETYAHKGEKWADDALKSVAGSVEQAPSLQEHKKARLEAGKRAERGETPEGITEKGKEAPAKEPWEMTLTEFAKTQKQDISMIMNNIWGDWQKQKLLGQRTELPDGIETAKQLYNKIKEDLLKDPAGARLVKVGNKEYVVADYEHKNIVRKALAEGKPVPPEVLKDYPDLKPADVKPETAKETGKPPVNTKLIAKIRQTAESMQKQIDAKRNPPIARQNVTARRARIAAGMAEEADYLEKIQAKLIGIADAMEAGTLPESLKEVNTKAAVESLMRQSFPKPYIRLANLRDLLEWTKGAKGSAEARKKLEILQRGSEHSIEVYGNNLKAAELLIKIAKDRGHNTRYIEDDLADYKRLLRIGIDSQEKFQQAQKDLASIGEVKSTVTPTEKKIKEIERSLIGTKIPGYFPTPKAIVEKMLEQADIQSGMSVLEPSAGKGNIADVIKEQHGNAKLTVIESASILRELLELKGHNLVGDDFLEHEGEYDRIIMNPPFEKGQDIDHVRHAYDLLKPGGRLVSIMSEGPFFRGDKKSKDFREWLDEIGGESEKLPEGAFKSSERPTGVNTRMVVIDKEEAAEIVPTGKTATAKAERGTAIEAEKPKPEEPEAKGKPSEPFSMTNRTM